MHDHHGPGPWLACDDDEVERVVLEEGVEVRVVALLVMRKRQGLVYPFQHEPGIE